MAYEMTWQMSRDNLDMAWWAVIGSTEQAILNKVESSTSVLESGNLQGHISRLTHARGGDVDKQQLSAIKVTYEKEYPFYSERFNKFSFIYSCKLL